MFTSDNQVGTGVLLIIGAALLLLGIQGTPLSRIAHGESSLEFALEQQAETIAERAIQEQPPEVAAAITEAVASVNPTPRLRHSAQSAYEDAVLEAIQRVGGSIDPNHLPGPGDRGVDARVQIDGNTVNVQIKSRMAGVLGIRDLQQAAEKVRGSGFDGGFLLVTNLPISVDTHLLNGPLPLLPGATAQSAGRAQPTTPT